MLHRCRVTLWLLLAALTLGSAASASVIKMRNGVVYNDARVLREDGNSLVIRTAYGDVTLPLAMVALVDGAPVTEIPPEAFSPAQPTPRVQPTARTYGEPLPAVSPSSARTPQTPAPAAPRPAPKPSATASPPPAKAPVAASTPVPVSLLARLGQWGLDLPVLYGIAAFVIVWALTIVLGQRALRTQPEKARTALYYTLFLPIIGSLWVVKQSVKRPEALNAPFEASNFEFLDGEHRPVEISTGEQTSGIEHAQDVLKDAMLDRASDVHIEPGADEYRIRFRINGQLHSRMKFPALDGLRLVSAIKTLSEMDISERRKAQDGRFGARSFGREVDFRVATTPSVYGEKLVLRILDHKSGLRGLNEMGMSPEMTAQFAQVIHSRSGMIVATGPTGSGKTSTLYTALSQLDTSHLNVVTIEDPVEYQLAGATQIPVNAKLGVTYESGLRSILRQDPDVILVGEMRDLEAAKIALRSALTGHLVFSSLHARDAVSTIMRLEEMGIERHLVASSLFVVIAQRLVRVLCHECREAYVCTGNELLEIGLALPAGETLYRSGGCRKCDGTGYTDRTGVFEMLVLDDEIRQAINNSAVNENDLGAMARAKGHRSYREEAAQKALLGITSIDEVLKAN